MKKIPIWWNKILEEEVKKDYYLNIIQFLEEEKRNWETIYPEENNIFNSLEKTPLHNVKVVILWQDPYHQKWQANWLSFSVSDWTKIPPSLKNIFKEISSDTWKEIPLSWNLEYLASQWVLLLNSILTVRDSKPASHSKIGWDKFTDEIIRIISKEKDNVIFLLWWAYAISKEELIDNDKHYILTTTHPSPLSSYRWFLWSKLFSKTNEILKNTWKKEINW